MARMRRISLITGAGTFRAAKLLRGQGNLCPQDTNFLDGPTRIRDLSGQRVPERHA